MKKFWRINLILWRNAWIRDSKISGSIFFKILMQFLDIAVSIVFFNVIFSNVPTLAGWNFYQVLFLFAFVKAIGTLHTSWTKKGVQSLAGEMIRMGDYDFYLTKPFDPMILVSISKPRIFTMLAFFANVGIMIYAAGKSGVAIGVVNIVWFLVLAIIGVVLYYFLLILTVIPTFWFTRLWAINDLMDRLSNLIRYPAGIYPTMFRFLLSAVFPIIVISYLPVKTLFYPPQFLDILYMLLITIAFALITKVCWRLGEKNYGSASS